MTPAVDEPPPGSGPAAGSSSIGRLVHATLACYPKWWKERYGDELGVLCSDLRGAGHRPIKMAAGLLLGAVDARVRGTGIPPVATVHLERARWSLVAATVPVLCSFPLLVWIVGSTGTTYAGLVRPAGTYDVTVVPTLGFAGRLTQDAVLALALLVVCAFMALTVAWRQVRTVLAGRGRKGQLLWWCPPVLGLGALGIAVLRARMVPVVGSTSGSVVHGRTVVSVTYLPGGHPLLAVWLALAVWAAFALMLASTVALAVAVGRSDLSDETLVTGVGIGRILSAITALSALAVVAWGLGLGLEGTATHASSAWVHSSLSAWSGVLGGVCVVAALASVAGVRQARRSAAVALRLRSPFPSLD